MFRANSGWVLVHILSYFNTLRHSQRTMNRKNRVKSLSLEREEKTKMSKCFQFLLKINLFPAKVKKLDKELKFSLCSKQMMGYFLMLLVITLPNNVQAFYLGLCSFRRNIRDL